MCLDNSVDKNDLLDHHRLGLQPFHQSILAGLASVAAVFHATEGGIEEAAIGRVDGDRARFQERADSHGTGDVAGVDGRGQAVGGVVSHFDGLLFGLEGLDSQDGAEDLVRIDLGGGIRIEEDGGFDEATLVALAHAACQHFGARRLARLQERHDPIVLRLVRQWSQVGLAVERVAHHVRHLFEFLH